MGESATTQGTSTIGAPLLIKLLAFLLLCGSSAILLSALVAKSGHGLENASIVK